LKGKTYENADSLVPLTLSARTLTWDPMTKTKEAKLLVKNVSKNSLKMNVVSQPYGFLKISLPDGEIKPGKEKEIKVKIDPTVKDLEFKKSFTFQVNDSTGTRYTVPTILSRPVMDPLTSGATEKKTAVGPDTTTKTNK